MPKVTNETPGSTPFENVKLAFAHPALAEDFRERDARRVEKLVDSTLLKPGTQPAQIEALCVEAVAWGFRSVCVPPCYVTLARDALARAFEAQHARLLPLVPKSPPPREVLVCTVVGFPNGYATTASKVHEASLLLKDAHEIDFVQNVGWVKAGLWAKLAEETRALVEQARAAGGTHGPGALVKVILETSLLDESEIRACTQLHAESGVHVVKTSTGFGSRGATLADTTIMAQALANVTAKTGLCYGIKASGGVRTRADALAHLAIGVTRIGTSSGASLAEGSAQQGTTRVGTGDY
ncbi:MAG: deoxyribose-phosphate aldolase [Silvanigrellales bacterium]|jgi:deoxyribose-phosphate aldolase|nr:deoxyribose-phosphate aldolase [Silvanigrellales bacterium]